MARRRYVSTTISQDTRVNKLAIKCGDFAALLYTWMIPHAADDATLPGDPEELLYQILPGRRDKTEADVQQALDGMAALGLIASTDDGRLMFPPTAFYKYQTYIKDRNKHGGNDAPEPAQDSAPPPPAQPTQTDSANQRKSAQNAVSFSPSFKSSPSFSPSPSLSVNPSGESAAPTPQPEVKPPVISPAPKGRVKRANTPPPDSFPITVEMEEWADATCPDVDLEAETQRFLDSARSHGRTYANWLAAWRGWMTNDYPKALKNKKQGNSPIPLHKSNAAAKEERMFSNVLAWSPSPERSSR